MYNGADILFVQAHAKCNGGDQNTASAFGKKGLLGGRALLRGQAGMVTLNGFLREQAVST